MAKTSGLRIDMDQLFSGAGVQRLLSTPVPEREWWCLRAIAWEINKATSGGNTRARLYVDRGAGQRHYLDEQLTPTADWLYTRSEDDWLWPGERLGLEVDQGQASTIVKLYAGGYSEREE